MKPLALKSMAVNTFPIPDNTRGIDSRGWREDVQTSSAALEEAGGAESVREFAGFHELTCHFSVSGAS